MKEDKKRRTFLVNGPTKTTTGIIPSIPSMVGGRRGRSCAPPIFVIVVIILGGYGYFVYNELTTRCTDTEGKLSFVMKKQSSLKSQLQGMVCLSLKDDKAQGQIQLSIERGTACRVGASSPGWKTCMMWATCSSE